MDLQSALQVLTEKNGYVFRRLCLKYVKDPGAVDDCLQEGYRKFLECGRVFAEVGDAEKFLFRLLVNHFIDFLRLRNVSVKRMAAFPAGEHQIEGSLSGPEDELRQAQSSEGKKKILREVAARVERLPPYQRELVDLMFFREPPMTLREVSKVKNVSFSTLYARLQAAIRSLTRMAADLRADYDPY